MSTNYLNTHYSSLISLPSSQRIPSIRASIKALPQSRTRVELLCLLYRGLTGEGAKSSARERAQAENILLEECARFLGQTKGKGAEEIEFGMEPENPLTSTVISLSNVLSTFSPTSLQRLPTEILCRNLLSCINTALKSPTPGLIGGIPSLSRLLGLCVSSLQSSSASLHALEQNTVNLALHTASLAERQNLDDPSPSTTLLLTHTALSLIAITSLLAHSHPDRERAPRLSSSILASLATFSPVIFAQYGGLPTSFVQLRRVFYSAADIVAASKDESESLVKRLAPESNSQPTSSTSRDEHRLSYLFTLSETLLPALTPTFIYTHLLPLCLAHLDDASSRAAFEAVHSLFLGIISVPVPQAEAPHQSNSYVPDMKIFVPYYLESILKHAASDTLTPLQFSTAFSSLVRTCASLPTTSSEPPTELIQSTAISGEALAWYCVRTLASALIDYRFSPTSPSHLHALQNALVASIQCVPLSLLAALLERVEAHVVFADDRREEALKAIWEAIRMVNEEGRGEALGWWLRVRARMEGSDERVLARL